LAQVRLLLPLLALAVFLVCFLTVAEGGSGGGAGDKLALAGSLSNLTTAGALQSASWGMSSSWERRRLVASSLAPPSPPFCLSRWKAGDGFFFFQEETILAHSIGWLFLRRNHPRPHVRWFLLKRRVYRLVRPSIPLGTLVPYHSEQSLVHRYGTKLKTLI
ncbi:hypothetical protein BHE74_00014141, partial [Ensete ventricosum]